MSQASAQSSTEKQVYLRIANKGVAPFEALTILGVSSSRTQTHPLSIGQFGSGAKHAVALLLRMGVNPYIYCGTTKLSYYTEPVVVKGQEYRQVYCRISGKVNGKSTTRTEKLGFVLDFGSLEWHGVEMALREFISNALDASLDNYLAATERGEFSKIHDVQVSTTNKIQAVDGLTQVFLPVTDPKFQYVTDIRKYFLHFNQARPTQGGFLTVGTNNDSMDNDAYQERVLTKVFPNIDSKPDQIAKPRIYRKGVFVGHASTQYPSLFHYNFGDELVIDESRNIRDYEAKSCAAAVITELNPQHLKTLIASLLKEEKYWEHTFHHSSIFHYRITGDQEKMDAARKKFKQAWGDALESLGKPKDAVLAFDSHQEMTMKDKGINCVRIDSTVSMEWVGVLTACGVRSAGSYMSKMEAQGVKEEAATNHVHKAFDETWNRFKLFNLISEETHAHKPRLRCFVKTNEGSTQTFGMYTPSNHTIYIEKSIADSDSMQLYLTMLEECVHAATQTMDFTRDFQDFLLRFSYMSVTYTGQMKRKGQANAVSNSIPAVIPDNT